MQTTYQRNNTITTHAQETVNIFVKGLQSIKLKITKIDLWPNIEPKPISPVTQAKPTEQRDFTNITLEIDIRQQCYF